MSAWHELAHFFYNHGFWYANPEIGDLSEEDLFWVPDETSLCILWHVGHIAHREQLHIGHFWQGRPLPLVAPEFEVFGTEWCPPERVREAIPSVQAVLDWAAQVREESHAYIDTLDDKAFHSVPPTSEGGLSVAHWLFITTAHTALHLGRIQMLRAMLLGEHDRPC